MCLEDDITCNDCGTDLTDAPRWREDNTVWCNTCEEWKTAEQVSEKVDIL